MDHTKFFRDKSPMTPEDDQKITDLRKLPTGNIVEDLNRFNELVGWPPKEAVTPEEALGILKGYFDSGMFLDWDKAFHAITRTPTAGVFGDIPGSLAQSEISLEVNRTLDRMLSTYNKKIK